MTDPRRSPARASLLASVERLRGLVGEHASASEERRTLAPEVVEALRASGLLAMATPRQFGGQECDPLTQLEVFEAMARADTSAGWCLMIAAMTAALAGGYLPDEGARRVFASPSTYIAGLQTPAGVARRVDGGYVLQGRWGFGSGVRHADWIFTAAVVEPSDGKGGEGPPAMPAMIDAAIPAAEVQIEDTWDVAGLRGSGSDHYRLDGVFVPEHLTCAYPDAAPRRGGALYRLPMMAMLTPAHVGFALGAARRALDEIIAVAPRRIKLWTRTLLGDHPAFHMDLGRASAKLAAARAYGFEVIGAMWDRNLTGEVLSVADWAAVRMSATYVTEVAAEVTGFAYHAGGGSALYASSPLQRMFRDVHAATQHIAATDDAYEFAGRALLGNAPESPMLLPRRLA